MIIACSHSLSTRFLKQNTLHHSNSKITFIYKIREDLILDYIDK